MLCSKTLPCHLIPETTPVPQALEQCSGQGGALHGQPQPLPGPTQLWPWLQAQHSKVGIGRVTCRQHLALHVVEEQPRATWKEGYPAFKGKD